MAVFSFCRTERRFRLFGFVCKSYYVTARSAKRSGAILRLFVHHACRQAFVHLSDSIFHHYGGRTTCCVTAGTHQRDASFLPKRADVVVFFFFKMWPFLHVRRWKRLFISPLNPEKRALVGQLSHPHKHRNMERCWSRMSLCWPCAVWIPPRFASYCERGDLPPLWICSCFSRIQLKRKVH